MIIIIFLGIAALLISKGDAKKTRGNSRTMMIYLDGSDLETRGGLATVELESIVPSSVDLDNINVLVYTGGSAKWHNSYISSNDNAIYKLTTNGLEKIESYSKKSVGNPNTLTEFLNYSYNNYKADNYDLFLWDHGAGVTGGLFDEQFSSDMIDISEFRDALNKSPFNKNNKLETVIFMTCLNGNLEMANLFSDYANYFVASEEISYSSTDYGSFGFISKIAKSSYGNEIGKAYVDEYKEVVKSVQKSSYDKIDSTYSVIDLSKIPTLMNKIDKFFGKINAKKDYKYLSDIRSNMHQYGEVEKGVSDYDTVDLYELIDNLKTYSKKDAEDIMNYIKNEVVVYNYSLNEHSNGLSIYFPYTGSMMAKSLHLGYYQRINVSKNYKNFIQDFNKVQSSTAYNFASDISDNEVLMQDGKVLFKLVGSQKINYSKSSYKLLRKVGEEFVEIYNGDETELNGDYAVADITKNLVKVVNDSNGSEEIIGVRSPVLEDKVEKYDSVAYIYDEDKKDLANLSIYFEGSNTTDKYDAKLINTSVEGFASNIGMIVDLKKINKIDIISNKYKILNSSGDYIDDWYKGIEDHIFTIEGNNYHFEKIDLNKDNIYCVFVVTDIQNNDYYSRLIEIK